MMVEVTVLKVLEDVIKCGVNNSDVFYVKLSAQQTSSDFYQTSLKRAWKIFWRTWSGLQILFWFDSGSRTYF